MLKEEIVSEIMVVVDDYGTGEIVYEGRIGGCPSLDEFEPSIWWDVHAGRPVVFATIDFGETLEAYKEWLAADKAFDQFLRGSFTDEAEAERERKSVRERYIKAQVEWERAMRKRVFNG